jgi:hypothetical protein
LRLTTAGTRKCRTCARLSQRNRERRSWAWLA